MPQIHQCQKCWTSSVWVNPSIWGRRFPRCYLCIRNNPSPIPWGIPVRRLKHTKHFHHLFIPWTRTKLCQLADGLPDLPFGPRTKTEEVTWWNQGLTQTSSTHTFHFCQSWNTTPTLCCWHQTSSLAMKASAATTSNIFYTLLDEKKRVSDQIMLNKFFAARFLFIINRRVQRWLRMC